MTYKVEFLEITFEALERKYADVRVRAHVEVRGKRYGAVVSSRPGDAHFPLSYTIRGAKTSRVLRYGATLEAIVVACRERIASWIGSEEHTAQRLRIDSQRLHAACTQQEDYVRASKRRYAETRRDLAKARRDLKAFQRKHPGVLP